MKLHNIPIIDKWRVIKEIYKREQGTVTILGFCPTGMGNPMLKLIRPAGRLNFNMELLVGRNPNIVTVPRL